MKKLSILLLSALLVSALCGCGAMSRSDKEQAYGTTVFETLAASSSGYYSYNEAGAEGEGLSKDSASGDSSVTVPETQKLIWTAHIGLQTKDIDTAVPALEQLVTGLGGYVQSSNTGGSRSEKYSSRYANYIIRIPDESLNAFLTGAGDIGNVISKSLSSQDVTLDYADTESRVKALEAQRDALLGMLEKAEKLEDLLTIQDHLYSVEYELESYASRLRTYDNKINFSTVTLELSEVVEYTVSDPGFGEQLLQTFKNSLEGVGDFFTGLAIFLLGNLPSILVFAAFLAIAFILVRRLVRRCIRKFMAKKSARNTAIAPNEHPKE